MKININFWEMFRESIILQGFLSVVLWGTAIYLMIVSQPIPDLLAAGCGAIMTFWFTNKTSRQVTAQVAAEVAKAADIKRH